MYGVQLRIRYHWRVVSSVLLALALLPVLVLTALTVNRARAITPDSLSASGAASGARQYYLSRSYVQADEAPSACTAGYHFASIWEIADPSTLRYNTTLGLPSSDSGEGPPTAISLFGSPVSVHGWVRTGYSFSTSGSIGQANCATWLSKYGFYFGTVANLPSNWTGGEQDVGVWNTEVRTCDTHSWVWCVQDDTIFHVYLPVVLR
jgi:hypothetical protein